VNCLQVRCVEIGTDFFLDLGAYSPGDIGFGIILEVKLE